MRRVAQGGPCRAAGAVEAARPHWGEQDAGGVSLDPKRDPQKGAGSHWHIWCYCPQPQSSSMCPLSLDHVGGAVTSPRLLVEINWKQELLPLSHVYYSYYLCTDLIPCNDLIC